MSGRISLQLRVAFMVAASLFSSGASEMRAQEASAGSSAASVEPDAIAGAKKEFESIKSAREGALLPKGGLPRVSLPEFSVSAPVISSAPTPKNATPERKPANWLVDAMEKQTDARDARGRHSRSRDRRGRLTFGDRNESTEEREGADSAKRTEDREQGDTPPVVNPLMHFLGDWMTPQDYALLKPGLTQSFDPAFNPKNSAALGTPGLAATLEGLGDFAFGGAPPPSVLNAPVQRENPYLKSLEPVLPMRAPGGGSKAVPAQLMPASAFPSVIPPPPQPVPTTIIPEFAKPAGDEKYFKQLKRF